MSDIFNTSQRRGIPRMRNPILALTAFVFIVFGEPPQVNSEGLPAPNSWIMKLDDALRPIPTPFLHNGEELTSASPLWPKYADALSRHTSIASCIMIPEGEPSEVDAMNFSWPSMKNHQDVEVCIFIIAQHLGSPITMSEWLRQQGYAVSEPKPLSTSNPPSQTEGAVLNILASLDGMTFNSRIRFKQSLFGDIICALLRTPPHHSDHMLNLYYDHSGMIFSVTSSRRGG